MTDQTHSQTHSHAPDDTPEDPVEAMTKQIPVIIPLAGAALMFLLASIAVGLA